MKNLSLPLGRRRIRSSRQLAVAMPWSIKGKSSIFTGELVEDGHREIFKRAIIAMQKNDGLPRAALNIVQVSVTGEQVMVLPCRMERSPRFACTGEMAFNAKNAARMATRSVLEKAPRIKALTIISSFLLSLFPKVSDNDVLNSNSTRLTFINMQRGCLLRRL